MNRLRAVSFVLLLGTFPLTACPHAEGTSSVAEEERLEAAISANSSPSPTNLASFAKMRPLSELRITVQGGNDAWRPKTQEAIEASLFRNGRFTSDPRSDTCKADFSVYYAITSNGELVDSAESGTALVGSEAMIHCRKKRAFETFRVELKESEDFKDADERTLSKIFDILLRKVSDKAADQLLGQVLVRPLTDQGIIQVLTEEKGIGKLMEAAIEAGERRLTRAVPQLLTLTKHQSHVVRLRAAAALGLLKTDTPDIIRALAGLTEGAKREQIVVAVGALSDIGGSRALRYLNNIAVSHPDDVVRALARSGAEKVKRQKR